MTVHLFSEPSAVRGEGPFLDELEVEPGSTRSKSRSVCSRNTGEEKAEFWTP